MLPEVLTISAWPPYSASHSSYSAFSLATGVSPSMMYAPPSHGSWNVSSRNSSKVRSSLRVAVVSPTWATRCCAGVTLSVVPPPPLIAPR